MDYLQRSKLVVSSFSKAFTFLLDLSHWFLMQMITAIRENYIIEYIYMCDIYGKYTYKYIYICANGK